jgi:hypothetical protein
MNDPSKQQAVRCARHRKQLRLHGGGDGDAPSWVHADWPGGSTVGVDCQPCAGGLPTGHDDPACQSCGADWHGLTPQQEVEGAARVEAEQRRRAAEIAAPPNRARLAGELDQLISSLQEFARLAREADKVDQAVLYERGVEVYQHAADWLRDKTAEAAAAVPASNGRTDVAPPPVTVRRERLTASCLPGVSHVAAVVTVRCEDGRVDQVHHEIRADPAAPQPIVDRLTQIVDGIYQRLAAPSPPVEHEHGVRPGMRAGWLTVDGTLLHQLLDLPHDVLVLGSRAPARDYQSSVELLLHGGELPEVGIDGAARPVRATVHVEQRRVEFSVEV